jgi:hypothetical protein
LVRLKKEKKLREYLLIGSGSYLAQIFNHSSTSITRRYIGIVEEDIRNIYLNL